MYAFFQERLNRRKACFQTGLCRDCWLGNRSGIPSGSDVCSKSYPVLLKVLLRQCYWWTDVHVMTIHLGRGSDFHIGNAKRITSKKTGFFFFLGCCFFRRGLNGWNCKKHCRDICTSANCWRSSSVGVVDLGNKDPTANACFKFSL